MEGKNGKFGGLFPEKTQEEVDRDPVYRKVHQEMAPWREAMTAPPTRATTGEDRMNMVEKVARALVANPPIERFEERDGETILIRDFGPSARAAIEAMREPTAAMVLAVSTEEKRRGYFSHEAMDADDAWPIMITAALKEEAK